MKYMQQVTSTTSNDVLQTGIIILLIVLAIISVMVHIITKDNKSV